MVCLHFLGENLPLDVSRFAVESFQKISEACGAVEGAKQSILPLTSFCSCVYSENVRVHKTHHQARWWLSTFPMCASFERWLCNSLSSSRALFYRHLGFWLRSLSLLVLKLRLRKRPSVGVSLGWTGRETSKVVPALTKSERWIPITAERKEYVLGKEARWVSYFYQGGAGREADCAGIRKAIKLF